MHYVGEITDVLPNNNVEGLLSVNVANQRDATFLFNKHCAYWRRSDVFRKRHYHAATVWNIFIRDHLVFDPAKLNVKILIYKIFAANDFLLLFVILWLGGLNTDDLQVHRIARHRGIL